MIARTRHDSTPAFPRFLAGGPDQLRLSQSSLTLLLGCAVAVTALLEAAGLGHVGAWPVRLLGAGGDVVAAVMTAAIAARWLGNRLAVAAGVIQLTALWVLGLPLAALWSDHWIVALTAVVMAAFAWANVSGRLPLAGNVPCAAAFYLGAGSMLIFCGWGELAAILFACLVYLLLNQDGRAFHFVSHPLGLGALAVLTGCTIWLDWSNPPPLVPAGWRPLAAAAVAMLPWLPLGAAAVAVGCWRGHYATPFWQLVACWLLSPLAFAALGLLNERLTLAMTSAPLSILAAAGLDDTVAWCRAIARRSLAVRRITSSQ
jgi:hypothetical protein